MIKNSNRSIFSLNYFIKLVVILNLNLLLAMQGTIQVFAASPNDIIPINEQQKSVTGRVTDTNGETLPGVNITVKGTTTGVTTDNLGKYTISVPNNKSVLVFSFVGMTSQEIVVGNSTQMDVILTEQTVGMQDIVVVGYGTQKKVNLTGAISTVTSEKLEMRPITSTAEGLQGLIPNLNITFTNGNPASSGVDFNIRGYESINGGAPLILVDGVPMDIQLINPNDIKSLTVLKDAAASAIYGARASFGVVLVTTKDALENEKDKVRIQYGFETSLSKPIQWLDIVNNSWDYVKWRNIANLRGDGTPQFSDRYSAAVKAYYDDPKNNPEYAVVNNFFEFYGYTDWKKLILRDFSPEQKHNLSISGKSKNSNYYISLGYLNKNGLVREGNDNYKRFNVLIKLEQNIKDWLTIGQKLAINSKNTNEPTLGDFNNIARQIPNFTNQFPKVAGYEQYEGLYLGPNAFYFQTNLANTMKNGGRHTYQDLDLWATSNITITPFKNFSIKGEFSYNIQNDRDEVDNTQVLFMGDNLGNQKITYFSPDDAGSSIAITTSDNKYYTFNTYAEYSLSAGSHFLKAMAGFNQEWGRTSFLNGTASGVVTPDLPDISLTNGIQNATGGKSHLALRGAFYRLNYIYNDKYLFEANGRYDGTSRFPKEDRFGFFPSFSVGWRISNERFMASMKRYMDNLKIRASYGTLGNQLLGSSYYPYISSMAIGQSNWIMNSGQITMLSAPGLVSSTLTWEKVISSNIGLDITLFKNKLDASFDFYTRDTKDMLMNAVLPSILGTASPKINGADLRTNGWEMSISTHGKIVNNLTYDATFILSGNKAEITKYNNPTGTLSDYYVGQKLGEIWGYETVGIFQDDAEVTNSADQSRFGTGWKAGDVHYADLDSSGAINPGLNTLADHGDLKVIGNTTPKYSYGLNFSFHYKNWSLATFFQGIGRKDYWPATGDNNIFWPFGANTTIENWMIKESWSVDNRDALFYAPNNRPSKNVQVQSRFLQNAAYLRVKNLTLSYNMPSKLMSAIGLNKGQVYLAGQNLWEFSKIHRPLDPENANSGGSRVTYPFQRTYTLGLNLTF
jgi:TonB-linked SusC/RagA family outer membrane protein